MTGPPGSAGPIGVPGTIGSTWTKSALAYGPFGPFGQYGTMLGMGLTYTPQAHGILLVTGAGLVRNTVALTNSSVGLRYGIGVPPNINAGGQGSFVGINNINVSSSDTNGYYGFAITGVISGLALGQPCWLDFVVWTNSSTSSVYIRDMTITMIEL
jgi:hypothetical protein